MLVMVVKWKAACKRKKDVTVNGNNNTVVVLQELGMVEQGVGADHSFEVHGQVQYVYMSCHFNKPRKKTCRIYVYTVYISN